MNVFASKLKSRKTRVRRKEIESNDLIVPVYINEKIVLDMLAIMEDGFSTVSQVNYTEYQESTTAQNLDAGVSTSASILSKLLKIDLKGALLHSGNRGKDASVSKEKVHTNVSLLSKFRSFLVSEKILNVDFDVSKMQIGDFVEVEGELQKNPLINYLDIFIDIFKMADIFAEKPELGQKKKAQEKQQESNSNIKQIKAFAEELKHSGTIDFVLSDDKGTVVLSAQEQYLSNDNISEILGGRFKVLGKVIAVCKDNTSSIDLLRKTTLSFLSENMLNEVFAGFHTDELNQFNLPEFKTEINGPAVIVIPVAIYA